MTEIQAPQPVHDGGPAFPHPDYLAAGEPGMSLRDYFAAKALPACWVEMDAEMSCESAVERSAQLAYLLADAMLKARGGAA